MGYATASSPATANAASNLGALPPSSGTSGAPVGYSSEGVSSGSSSAEGAASPPKAVIPL